VKRRLNPVEQWMIPAKTLGMRKPAARCAEGSPGARRLAGLAAAAAQDPAQEAALAPAPVRTWSGSGGGGRRRISPGQHYESNPHREARTEHIVRCDARGFRDNHPPRRDAAGVCSDSQSSDRSTRHSASTRKPPSVKL
jgi:hypothetical protein